MPWTLDNPRNEAERTVADYVRTIVAAAAGQPLPAGQHYASMFHILAEHGRFWTPTPRPSAVRKRPAGRCFRNAISLLRDTAAHADWHYCEGCAVMVSQFPVHHGWLVDGAGRVIDPTWNDNAVAYFGVVFDRGFALACRKRPGGMNTGLLNDWIHGSPLLRADPAIWLPQSGCYARAAATMPASWARSFPCQQASLGRQFGTRGTVRPPCGDGSRAPVRCPRPAPEPSHARDCLHRGPVPAAQLHAMGGPD